MKRSVTSICAAGYGRVILNLITNAFYTVSEKKKQAGDDYEPIRFSNYKKNK
jgi:hypothetical protein